MNRQTGLCLRCTLGVPVGPREPVRAGRVARALKVGAVRLPPVPALVDPLPPARETPWTLDVLGEPAVAFVAAGAPAPQGSKEYKGHREKRTRTGAKKLVPVLVESSRGVKPWREAVAAAARRALPVGWVALDGPLVVDMVFTLPHGRTLPRWLDWHERYPDVSKLTRATEDALTRPRDGGWPGVWLDDAQVRYRRQEKFFTGSWDSDSLTHPGAVVRVWRVPEHLIEARRAAARCGALREGGRP